MPTPAAEYPTPSPVDRRGSGYYAVALLVVVNVAIFLLQLLNDRIHENLALPADPSEVWERPWTVVTVVFFHEHVLHLGLMLAMLVVFGVALEKAAGARSVIGVYIASGVAGALAAVAASGFLDVDDPAVGSSAAVFGITAAFAALRPAARMLGGKTVHWVAAIVVANVALFASLPLGSVAHLAGVGTGLLAGRFVRMRRRSSPSDDV